VYSIVEKGSHRAMVMQYGERLGQVCSNFIITKPVLLEGITSCLSLDYNLESVGRENPWFSIG
jgi:hypothetical protein